MAARKEPTELRITNYESAIIDGEGKERKDMYEWSALIKLWEREQVTETQVIGQLLKYGEAQQTLLTALQRQFEQVEQRLTPHP